MCCYDVVLNEKNRQDYFFCFEGLTIHLESLRGWHHHQLLQYKGKNLSGHPQKF